jgi:hypothetical protein
MHWKQWDESSYLQYVHKVEGNHYTVIYLVNIIAKALLQPLKVLHEEPHSGVQGRSQVQFLYQILLQWWLIAFNVEE